MLPEHTERLLLLLQNQVVYTKGVLPQAAVAAIAVADHRQATAHPVQEVPGHQRHPLPHHHPDLQEEDNLDVPKYIINE